MDDQGTTTGGPGNDEPQSERAEVGAKGEQAWSGGEADDVVAAKVPEFSSLTESATREEIYGIDRFYDVQVPVWAELGRLEMPIGDLLKLGEGAVVRLGRPVTDPVDLVAQGVRLARGEVVVVDDNFAIRIKEIESTKKKNSDS